MRFSRPTRRAFTLLEVLMAVGIFALAGMGLLLALDAALDGARATQREARIRDGLSSRLARLAVGPPRAGVSEDEEDGVAYRSEVEREEVSNQARTLLRGFWRLRVTAEWPTGDGPQKWSVSHLVYRSDG